MSVVHDHLLLEFMGGFFLVLAVVTIGARIARRARRSNPSKAVDELNARTDGWWTITVVLALAVLAGNGAMAVLFLLISLQALREFLALTPTVRADHPALVLAFFLTAPIQYALVVSHWYGMFAIFIPVYAFLLLPARMVIAGDTRNFLQRAATVQWALMSCVYCLSYVPATLNLHLDGAHGHPARLLLFLVVVVQAADVLRNDVDIVLGRHQLAPTVDERWTWEGFLLGNALAIGLGTAMWWITPFTPLQAAGMSTVIVVMGSVGGLVMAGIKRDRGLIGYGHLIPGHGGVLDRFASLLFAAPIFFHVSRYFFR